MDLRGCSVEWASKKSSKKHVIEVPQLNLSPFGNYRNVNVSLCSSAEDSSRDRAADPVRNRQCNQRLVPSPHRNHQLTRKNILKKRFVQRTKEKKDRFSLFTTDYIQEIV